MPASFASAIPRPGSLPERSVALAVLPSTGLQGGGREPRRSVLLRFVLKAERRALRGDGRGSAAHTHSQTLCPGF